MTRITEPAKSRSSFLSLGLLAASLAIAPLRYADADAVHLTGHAVQGGMMVAKAPPGSSPLLNGQPIPISEHGFFVFAFGKDAIDPVTISVTLPNRGLWEQTVTPRQREFKVQSINGLNPDQVTPPPEVTQRIAYEADLARGARQTISELLGFTEPFIWPVVGRLTGVYGSQRILNGQPRAPHWGVDIAAPLGTEVRSPASGRVVLVHQDMYFSGGTVFIDHGLGVLSAFLHLEDILVEEGRSVQQGEVFATVGSTGRSTGPHLDWRVSWGNVRIDPELLVDPM